MYKDARLGIIKSVFGPSVLLRLTPDGTAGFPGVYKGLGVRKNCLMQHYGMKNFLQDLAKLR